MPLPTLSKVWQFSKNNKVRKQSITTLDTHRLLMRTLKNALIGFGSMPWTVVGSSDSSAAGLDAVDRWVTDSNLVWNATTRSWIVLRQIGIAANFELCIDLNSGTDYYATIVVSPSAGFTGGATNARPTATDEIVLINTTSWGPQSSAANYVLHAMQSTDGQCTRLFICTAGVTSTFLMFDKPNNPVTGWSNPSIAMWKTTGGTTEVVTHSNMLQSGAGSEPARSRGSATMNGTFSLEGASSQYLASLLTFPNDLSGEWPMYPLGYFVANTASNRGRHGSVYDLWGAASVLPTSTLYPQDGTRQFVQFGQYIFPWDGSYTPELA